MLLPNITRRISPFSSRPKGSFDLHIRNATRIRYKTATSHYLFILSTELVVPPLDGQQSQAPQELCCVRWLRQLRVHIQPHAQVNKRAEIVQEPGAERMRAHKQLVGDLRGRVAHLEVGREAGQVIRF